MIRPDLPDLDALLDRSEHLETFELRAEEAWVRAALYRTHCRRHFRVVERSTQDARPSLEERASWVYDEDLPVWTMGLRGA